MLSDCLVVASEDPTVGDQERLRLFQVAKFFSCLEYRDQLMAAATPDARHVVCFVPRQDRTAWNRVVEHRDSYVELLHNGLWTLREIQAAWPRTLAREPLYQWVQAAQSRLAAAISSLRAQRDDTAGGEPRQIEPETV